MNFETTIENNDNIFNDEETGKKINDLNFKNLCEFMYI